MGTIWVLIWIDYQDISMLAEIIADFDKKAMFLEYFNGFNKILINKSVVGGYCSRNLVIFNKINKILMITRKNQVCCL